MFSRFRPLSIGLNTFIGFTRDRIFHATMLLALALVLFSYALSSLTIVETQKILLDFGLMAISLSGVAIAIFLGISSVAKELEAKTIYTVLSKPISRTTYLIGKYLGCSVVLFVVHLMIAATLAALVSAMGGGMPTSYWECVYLMYLESLVILAIALFASIFSSTILSTSFTIGMFIIGRSAYFFMTLSDRSHDAAQKMLFKALYYFLPNLDRFNIRDVTAYSKPYPDGMLLTSSAYFVAYTTLFLVMSAYLFQRRDLP